VKVKTLAIGFAAGVVFLFAIFAGGLLDRYYNLPILSHFGRVPRSNSPTIIEKEVVNEESVVTKVAAKAAPSVVTVSVTKQQLSFDDLQVSPLDPFGFFRVRPKTKKVQQDIGTGFIVDSSGLVITNKHVVADGAVQYRVITKDNKVYPVKAIYRDQTNDLAILRIEAKLPALPLGNSDNLKVGQLAIAIGTALGKFRHTVTVGVISGLGRGITAGSPLEGYVERLDNVIQTDAAINPGNSGGPLLNSAGQVVGINVAVAERAQNIGFAIPINVVKSVLANFKATGEFQRPFLGVRYQMISRQAALLNDVPQGAYIRDVISNSPADKAGIKPGDILVKFGNERLNSNNKLAELVNKTKVGQVVAVEIWRNGKMLKLKVKLEIKGK